MFFLIAVPLFIVLPSPWNIIGGFASLAIGIGEFTFWQRRMRGNEVQTGVERLVGQTGVVSVPLAPTGQIHIVGEIWAARSTSELSQGARVRVVAVDGLVLDVEPVEQPGREDRGRPDHAV